MTFTNTNDLSMAELTEEELSSVTGAGDGSFGGPTIIAFNSFKATSFHLNVDLSFTKISKTSFFAIKPSFPFSPWGGDGSWDGN